MEGNVFPNSNETKHEYMISLLINPRLWCCSGVSMSCTKAYVTINIDNANQHRTNERVIDDDFFDSCKIAITKDPRHRVYVGLYEEHMHESVLTKMVLTPTLTLCWPSAPREKRINGHRDDNCMYSIDL